MSRRSKVQARVLARVVLAATLALLVWFETGGDLKATSTGPAYRDPKLPVDKRVADLLKRMTLAEKVAQLGSVNWDKNQLDDPKTHELSAASAEKLLREGIGEITRPGDRHDASGAVAFANAIQKFLAEKTRLGIPALLHEESLHGLVAPGGTSFPQAIGLAATFDPELIEQIFTVAARQARARGVQHVLAPVIDVARDPRWGRIEETYGEDPYLVTRLGVAAIHGFQGRQAAAAPIDGQHVLATAKHFTAHGTPEGGRNTAPGNYSAHVIREVFLPPFEAAVREANVATVMASYNELDGIPSHASHWLLDGAAARRMEVPRRGRLRLLRHRRARAQAPRRGDSARGGTRGAGGGRRSRGAADRRVRHAGRRREGGAPADRDHRPGGGARPAGEVPARPLRASLRRREARRGASRRSRAWPAARPTRRSCS